MIFKRESIKPAEIVGWQCLAKDPLSRGGRCQQTADDWEPLPRGWRVILIASGSLLEEKNLFHAQRDGVLCSRHVAAVEKTLVPQRRQ